jgi:hypothetical protein
MGEFDKFRPFSQLLEQRAHPKAIQACKSRRVNPIGLIHFD